MRGRLALAALAALGIGAGAQAAPATYDGNFTSRDCAFGGGFLYCDASAPTTSGSGFVPRGMRYGHLPPMAGGSPAGSSTGASHPGSGGSAAGYDGGGNGSAPGPSGGGGSRFFMPGSDGGGGSGLASGPSGNADESAPTPGGGSGMLPDGSEVAETTPPGGGTPSTIPPGGGGDAPAMTAVPEPGSLALLGTALAALGITRRRARG